MVSFTHVGAPPLENSGSAPDDVILSTLDIRIIARLLDRTFIYTVIRDGSTATYYITVPHNHPRVSVRLQTGTIDIEILYIRFVYITVLNIVAKLN